MTTEAPGALKMHNLLAQQLSNAFPDKQPEGDAMAAFLRIVSEAYAAADEERNQLQRSHNRSADDLFEHARRLRNELEERKKLQLRMSEKLRAMSQLATGVVHEINTPVQFTGDSVQFLQMAFTEISQVLATYQQAAEVIAGVSITPEQHSMLQVKLSALKELIDLPFLLEEIPQALARCAQGTDRVMNLMRALKEFAALGVSQQAVDDLGMAMPSKLMPVARAEMGAKGSR